MQTILEAKNISKFFGRVKALDKVEIRAYSGKVNILIGENGAGKSTIMNIISGGLKPDQGEVIFEGKKIINADVKYFQKMGIGIVHQEIKLVDNLTVAENIFLGRERKNAYGLINYKEMNYLATNILSELDPDINPKSKAKTLSIAEKQIVEIAKALSQKTKVLIFDEPTSSIGLKETEKLFQVINKLRKNNIAILYITHRMEEIKKLADVITIYRDGQFVIETPYSKITNDKIIELMVGRKLGDQFPETKKIAQKVSLLKVKNFNNKYVKNINFEIKTGEILGFAGLIGAKRTELFKSILGFYPFDSGSIYFKNKKVIFSSPTAAIKNKIYYISEDRKTEGLFLEKTINFNNSISSLNQISLGKGAFILSVKEKNINENINNQLQLKYDSVNQLVKNLSGGNQQKVAISKALLTKSDLIIFDEPTRGVDVYARKEIYEIIQNLKLQNKAIVVISSDLPEIIGIADRLIVMHEGKIKVDTTRKITQKQIMNFALGIKKENYE